MPLTLDPVALDTNELSSWPIRSRRYATAILSTVVVIWVRSLLHPWLNEECPFSLFYLSVLLTAWIAGSGPAMLAVVLGTLAAAHFFIPPESSLLIENLPDMLQLAIYVFVNCVAIYLFDRAARQRSLAEKRSGENERLSDDLRQADVRKDEFLALLAHELRNPLAPIRSSLALLQRKGDSPEVVERMRDVIQRQTTHLIRITDDLLDVSRFCRGKVELQVCRIDLRLAIDDAIEMVESSFEAKSQRFNSLIPMHPIWVTGDRVRLAQLTANLLGNASKYTPESGRITLNLEQIDDSITMLVSDNGIGFDSAHAERIFDPFVQIDTSRTREYGGLGVGLTIVNRLVTLHHGTLLASSRGPGMGSCFAVTLPAADPMANESVSSRDLFDGQLETADRDCDPSSTVEVCADVLVRRCGDTADRPGDSRIEFQNEVSGGDDNENREKTVLLVEDNADASAILAELFQSEGYQVHMAYDGVEAIQKAIRFHPDVIVMDIGLPGMDGYETARRLRRSPSTAETKLVALTGWGGSADRELANQAGFDLHLIKPVSFRELFHNVETFVAQSRRERSVGRVAMT